MASDNHLIISTLNKVYNYLQKTSYLPDNFKENIENILVPIDKYLDKNKKYYNFIKPDCKNNSWLVIIIATYKINNQEISINLCAYLDEDSVKFLKPNTINNPFAIVEENISSYLLFNGQNVVYQDQQLAFLHSQINKLYPILPRGTLEIIKCLDEAIKEVEKTGLVINHVDNLIKSCIEILNKSNQVHDLKWNNDLLNKVILLRNVLDMEIEITKVVEIYMLILLPHIETFSKNLFKIFNKIIPDICIFSSLTLDFLYSLCREIVHNISNNCYIDCILWEKAILQFFECHQHKCFTNFDISNYKSLHIPSITSTTDDCNITSMS